MKWELIEPQRGDMIRVKIGALYHYGIFITEEDVIQFGVNPQLRVDTPDAPITVCSTDIDTFLCGEFLEVGVPQNTEHKKKRSAKEVERIARNRLGEGGYHLLYNNCEHFAYECVFGVKYCSQTEDVRMMFRNMSTTDVYVASVPQDPIGTVIPHERQQQIEQTTHEGLRRQRYYVWKLLEYALLHSYGLKMKDMTFQKDKNGKWSCDECCFSLSHSGDALAVAVSRTPVGVDIESLERTMHADLSDAIFTPREATAFEALPEEERLTYWLEAWSAKESIFKAGTESTFRPASLDTQNAYRSCIQIGTTRYCLTVCAQDIQKIKIHENARL